MVPETQGEFNFMKENTPISLSSIMTGRENKPPRLVVYGPMGIGKTTLGSSAPSPIFIQCEDGVGKLDYARFPAVKSFAEVMECLTVLYKESHNYKTLVIDSISWLEAIIHSEIRASKGDDVFATFGRGYKLVPPYFERIIKACDKLREDKGMMILLLGHSDVERYESPEVEPYDRYTLNCHDNIQDTVFQWCDAMLFATYRVFTKSDETGFNQKRTRGIGSGERVIFTEERPTHKAKNRFDLPYEIPFERPFNWKALLSAVGWKGGFAEGKA